MDERVQLVVNGEQHAHGDAVVELLGYAHHFECMVAFAKGSALATLLKPLEQALARGMTARVAVGLSFHLTEPALLRKLLYLSTQHAMQLYLSDTNTTFHPKIYAGQAPQQSTVIVGSANMTAGGLGDNHEASVMINGSDNALFLSVQAQFNQLIADGALVHATKKRVDAYAVEFSIQDAWRKMAKKRADRVSRNDLQDLTVLVDHLNEMKRDDSSHGFAAQQVLRQGNLRLARHQIRALAVPDRDGTRSFLTQYETLINLFHSGGLHRAKTRVASEPARFLAAIADITSQSHLGQAEAFNVLHTHFQHIKGAGINLLTEILHALNHKRYAVMNQNAVTGLAVAGFGGYPVHPTKTNVDGELYARYCQQARSVQKDLGLSSLTELDALFNYVYWQEEPET
ncbi:NgoFVII family restriction endonuclease [Pseudomonas sp. ABC1]|uniref:phospholipase D family protein n=1 Tax=Pseudomonas sp. ABC1 TaxID=2748080 RepID=UPI0015C38C04|nr:phospholipase D family protein [Pseudomonas sp. ABC1]QLF92059.1 NgoFVII family restriction endonuclease [Pseudomonas sp. ABC1]